MLEVPWNAPEAVVHLHSDGVVDLDLDTVPDDLGLAGRRPEAVVIRVLHGRDQWSVRALIPDPRVEERGFHDVTIVDMGDLSEPPLSLGDLSQLRLACVGAAEYGVALAGLGSYACGGQETFP